MKTPGEYQREKRARQMHQIRLAKEVPCADCDGEFPYYVMTFDHVPERGPKEFTFGHLNRRPVSQEKLQRELFKCDVVCANCQAIRTYKRMNGIPF